MEKGFIQRIVENFNQEFYKNKNYAKCLSKAKAAYELLEKDELKSTKEQCNIYLTLLMIIRCKTILKKYNKDMRKYILLSLIFAQTRTNKIFSYFLLSKYYRCIGNFEKEKYYLDKVDKYENELNEKGCFSRTYSAFIS